MTNSDLGRILKSDEIQRVIRPKSHDRKRRVLKRNPLKCIRTLRRLNPHALVHKRNAIKKHLKLSKVVRKPAAAIKVAAKSATAVKNTAKNVSDKKAATAKATAKAAEPKAAPAPVKKQVQKK
jgi:large subunit ribosomal protein L4e